MIVARVVDRGCEVSVDGRTIVLSARWLHAHDDGPAGLDPRTGQRTLTPSNGDAVPLHAEATVDGLRIAWSDGRHTEHTDETVAGAVVDAHPPVDRLARPPDAAAPARDLWCGNRAIDPLDFESVVADDGHIELLRQLQAVGFAVVDGVAPGEAPVQRLVEPLGYVRETIFGGIWELEAGLTDHADTAYDTTFLGPHVDGTYSHDGPGLQWFVCQALDGAGGESILVDGFAAAADLAGEQPEAASLLASVSVPCRYVEPGVSLRSSRPVLRADRSDRLVQVSFNPYDRAPFVLADPDEWDRFDAAYDAFGRVLADESRWQDIGWRPGRLMVIDNWRVLHGRRGFSGLRRFLGAYTNHEDFESALRVGGLSD